MKHKKLTIFILVLMLYHCVTIYGENISDGLTIYSHSYDAGNIWINRDDFRIVSMAVDEDKISATMA